MTPMYKQREGYPEQNAQLTNIALPILKKSPLFADFSEVELLELFPVLQPVLQHYIKDNIIIEEGDTTEQIGFVVRGRIVARKMTSGGHIHILAMHEVGDDFGFDAALSSYKTSPLTFIADTDSVVLFVSTACFFDRTGYAGVRIMNNASRMLADKCVRLLYKTDVLSKQSLRERILTYFIILEKKSQSGSFMLKMSREQLAQYLCVNRSALSRELSRMQSERLIEIKQEGQIHINYDRRI